MIREASESTHFAAPTARPNLAPSIDPMAVLVSQIAQGSEDAQKRGRSADRVQPTENGGLLLMLSSLRDERLPGQEA